MRVLSLAVATALLLSMIPATAAEDGSLVGTSASTLWMHQNTDFDYWMNSLQTDPNQNAAGNGYNPLGWVLGAGSVSWTIPMSPALANDVELDQNGMVKMIVSVSASPAVTGVVGVSSSLLLDGVVIASDSSDPAPIVGGGEVYELEATPSVASLPAGSAMSWVIEMTGATGGMYLTAEGDDWSRVELPAVNELGLVATEGAQSILEEVNGTTLELSHAFEEATTMEYMYNWSAPEMEGLTISATGDIQNGTVDVLIYDPDGAEVYTEMFSAETMNGSLSENIQHLANNGTWQVGVFFTDFIGSFDASVTANEIPAQELGAPPGESSEPTPPGEGGVVIETTPEDGNSTVDDAGEADSKDSPIGALGFAVLGLLAVAIARRK